MNARSKAKLLSLVIRSSSNDELELIIRRIESELKRRGVDRLDSRPVRRG